MKSLIHICLVVLACAKVCSAVNCQCMVKAVNSDATDISYTLDISPFFGQSKTCDECNKRCETELNKITNNGDLMFVPYPNVNMDSVGALLCSYLNNAKSTGIQLFSICERGQPQMTNFALKNPGYICCRNRMWPDAMPNGGDKCEPV